jgi:seryl-tRNA synthetase
MHNIKLIRDFPDKFDAMLKARGAEGKAQTILQLDEQVRKLQAKLQELNTERNDLAKQIGQAKARGENVDSFFAKGEAIKHSIQEIENDLAKVQQDLDDILSYQPNFLAADVPYGKDEKDNQEARRVGTAPTLSFTPLEHFELGEKLGMMNFEQTAKISGSRFVTLSGHLARMERALASFMLDIHTKEFGYTEVCPPLLVREQAVYGTGQFPKLAEDLFKTTDGYFLVPTSEVSLTNQVADMIIAEEKLPMRLTAYSSCFRSEAGSAGKDTKGMLRQHQFSKVEIVSITTEEDSEIEHERMTSAAEEILKRLKLPYRVMTLCSGDIGFAARKTYDLEVWLPGQNCYREISSCSNCGDFQARRMKTRYKSLKDKKNYFVHTLNGSGLAIGRTIIAIMENYQNADGTISVPEALQPYMDGLKLIERE